MQAGRIYRANLLATLRLLRDGRARTCPEICDELGLAAPTVSRLTAAVQQAGLVDAIGLDISGRPGRPPRLWQLRPDAACTVGVWLRRAEIGAIAVDLVGSVIGRRALALPDDWSLADLPAIVARLAADLASEVRADAFVGVGVAVAGLIDAQSGTILASETLGVPSAEHPRYALGNELEAALERPVLVGHDASLGAVALHRHAVDAGDLEAPDPLLYVIPNEETTRWSSAGVVLAGQPHPGIVWGAGSDAVSGDGSRPASDAETVRAMLLEAARSTVWLSPRRLFFGGPLASNALALEEALAETNAALAHTGAEPVGVSGPVARLDPLWPDTVPLGAALTALDSVFEPASDDDVGLLEMVDPHRWPCRQSAARPLAG